MSDLWMNPSSFLLGLAAWFLPLYGLRRQRKKPDAQAVPWCWASALCCAGALCLQIQYGDGSVQAGDWSALMDTSDVVAGASAFLLGTSFLVELGVLLAAWRRKRRGV